MTSNDVVKSVSKKLKFYFEVKRREDGFDLTGPACPKLDHPPLKSRPTLMYDGLHDRPLKHYFSPRSAKTVLTQFKVPDGKTEQEKNVKKKLETNMKKYQFVHSSLPDTYYRAGRGNRRILRPEAVGFGVQTKRTRSANKGAYPVLRSRPTDYVTRGEAKRLVNVATKLLLATETVDLKGDDKENQRLNGSRPSTAKSRQQNSKNLPQIEGEKGKKKIDVFLIDLLNPDQPEVSDGRKKSKYTYDIHGRRVKVPQKSEEEADSSYGTRPSSSHTSFMTINGEVADDKKVPVWLKKQMSEQPIDSSDEDKWVRPHSAHSAQSKKARPPSGKHRPKSAADVTPRPVKKQHTPAKPQHLPLEVQPAAWDLEVCSSAPAESDDQDSVHATDTTSRKSELLREYDPMEKVIWDGEHCRYTVHVFTGSRLGASTKADVKIIFCGDRGRTEENWLLNSKNHVIKFQKGQEDIFDVETFYVGALRKICIGHDRNELGFGWYLEKVSVKDCARNTMYEIPCEKWLSSKDGDGSTVKDFHVQSSSLYEGDDRSEDEEVQAVREPIAYAAYQSTSSDSLQQQPISKPSPAVRIDSSVSSSHTSVNTIPSETRNRRGRDSSPSSYTSSSSSYQSHPSDTSRSTTTPRPPSPTPVPTTRKDDFFDQSVPDKDYASVIDSLVERENDFVTLNSYGGGGGSGSNVGVVQPSRTTTSDGNYQGETATITLKSHSNEEQERLNQRDASQASLNMLAGGGGQDVSESESDTARLSINTNQSPGSSRPEQGFMDGFKAGMEAAQKSVHEDEEKEALEREKRQKDEEDFLKGTSIHHAAKLGDLDRVKALVAHSPQVKTSSNEKGLTALHVSAEHGQKEVLQWLCVQVTDLDVVTPTGYTPIHLAARNANTASIQVLAAMGAQIDSLTVEQQTPLHLAAMGGHIECVKWLIANGAKLSASDHMDRSPLQLAEEYNKTEVVDFLRACEKENPNSPLSQLRNHSPSKSTLTSSDDSSDTTDDSSTTDSSTTSSSTHSTDSGSQLRSSKRPGSVKGTRKHVAEVHKTDSTDSELDTRTKQKHDGEIEVKRQIYDEHKTKMVETHTSFLDSIRDEYS